MKTIRIGDGRVVAARDDVEVRKMPPASRHDEETGSSYTARPLSPEDREAFASAGPPLTFNGALTPPTGAGGTRKRTTRVEDGSVVTQLADAIPEAPRSGVRRRMPGEERRKGWRR